MSEQQDTSKLWGGRFSEATDAFVQRFTASVEFDQRMAAEDIAGSLAHAECCAQSAYSPSRNWRRFDSGLDQVQRKSPRAVSSGRWSWKMCT